MAVSLDLDSSDFEDVAAEDDSILAPRPTWGSRIQAAIIRNQATDRPRSKKNARELTFAKGAPGTRYHQHVVAASWDAFCSTIKHDPMQCPNGEQILRFLDTRVHNFAVARHGKPAPNLTTIQGVWRVLISLPTFRHREFPNRYTSHDVSRINTHLDHLVRKGHLFRGRWTARQCVGFPVIRQLTQVWLDRHLHEGARSWDIVMMRLLGLLLQAACAARRGEITRADYYHGMEYMRYEHLTLSFASRGPGLDAVQNLTLTVVIAYEKGAKDLNGVNRTVVINPMAEELSHTCVIRALLVVALRLGHVYGTTITEVLARAAARHDGIVEWTTPQAPVICRMHSAGSGLIPDQPARGQQISQTLKKMALAAGLVTPVTTHDIRRGAARDIAHVVAVAKHDHFTSLDGERHAALALGHSGSARRSGLTQSYMGSEQVPLWNLRAENILENRFGPKWGQTQYAALSKTSKAKANLFMAENGMSNTDKPARNRAKRPLKQRAETAGEISSRASHASETNAGRLAPSVTDKADQSEWSGTIDPQLLLEDVQLATGTLTEIALNAQDLRPHPLDNEDTPEEVSAETMDALHSLFVTQADEAIDDETLADALAITDNDRNQEVSSGPLPDLTPPDPFITNFARINVLLHQQTTLGKRETRLKLDAAAGNSRDPPWVFKFTCIKCGEFQHVSKVNVEYHALNCKGKKTGTVFDCTVDGCDKSYSTKESLRYHVKTEHEWTPRACLQCPDKPDVLYDRYKDLTFHRQREHKRQLDRSQLCPLQSSCGRTEPFTIVEKLKLHLQREHRMSYGDIKAAGYGYSLLTCPLANECGNADVWGKVKLRPHLRTVHGKSVAESLQLVPAPRTEQQQPGHQSDGLEAVQAQGDGDGDGDGKNKPAKRQRKKQISGLKDGLLHEDYLVGVAI